MLERLTNMALKVKEQGTGEGRDVRLYRLGNNAGEAFKKRVNMFFCGFAAEGEPKSGQCSAFSATESTHNIRTRLISQTGTFG